MSVYAGERPSTPPSKQEAFEMFKLDYGKRLSTIFQENKGMNKFGQILKYKTDSVLFCNLYNYRSNAG